MKELKCHLCETLGRQCIGCKIGTIGPKPRPEDDLELEKPMVFPKRIPVAKFPRDEAPLNVISHREWRPEHITFNPPSLPDLRHKLHVDMQPLVDAMRMVSLGVEEMGKNIRRRHAARLAITSSYAPTLGPGKDI